MTDFLIVVALAAFWGGVALYLNRKPSEPQERRLNGFRFANARED